MVSFPCFLVDVILNGHPLVVVPLSQYSVTTLGRLSLLLVEVILSGHPSVAVPLSQYPVTTLGCLSLLLVDVGLTSVAKCGSFLQTSMAWCTFQTILAWCNPHNFAAGWGPGQPSAIWQGHCQTIAARVPAELPRLGAAHIFLPLDATSANHLRLCVVRPGVPAGPS